MIDLGTLGGKESVGMAVNASCHVVGYSTLEPSNDYQVHAFLYDGAKMRDLGSLESWIGADESYALGVNLMDQVVGYSYTLAKMVGPGDPPVRQTAFIYSNGQMSNLNALLGATTEPYWLRSATGINNNGQIIAIAENLNTNELHAVLLTP
jgi:probable HAF family extracellular repeat protein